MQKFEGMFEDLDVNTQVMSRSTVLSFTLFNRFGLGDLGCLPYHHSISHSPKLPFVFLFNSTFTVNYELVISIAWVCAIESK